MIDITTLSEERWQDYRDLRLESLQRDPLAFGSSYEHEVKFSEEDWRERMGSVLFALDGDKPVGMITYFLDDRPKFRHRAKIYGVYVSASHRGQGIASQLLETLFDILRADGKVRKVTLTVNPIQEAAVKLYEKHGFSHVGHYKDEMYHDGAYYDFVTMQLFL